MKITKNIAILLAIFVLLPLNDAFSQSKIKAKTGESIVQYTIVHPLHTIIGKNKNPYCTCTYDESTGKITSVEVVGQVMDFSSDNSNRDSHMGEVVEALDYPEVKFVSSAVDLIRNDSLYVKGNLTFHGVTKPIGFWVAQSVQNGKTICTGSFDISLTEYKIERPALVGVKTEDKLAIWFKTVFPRVLKK
ncbi:MAG: YceI family protein [Chloroherpetonaceae bacterium]